MVLSYLGYILLLINLGIVLLDPGLRMLQSSDIQRTVRLGSIRCNGLVLSQ